jgi:hypothetical protein
LPLRLLAAGESGRQQGVSPPFGVGDALFRAAGLVVHRAIRAGGVIG